MSCMSRCGLLKGLLKALAKIWQFLVTPSFKLVLSDAALSAASAIGLHFTGEEAYARCAMFFLILMAADTCLAWNCKKEK